MSAYTWIWQKIRKVRVVPRRRKNTVLYKKHKESTRELVHRKIAHFNLSYNFSFKKVAIRNQRSRWGSCSQKGNLNFNYRLIHLPDHLVDYVVVHELCHLGEFNHSKQFWNLVAQTLPNHVELRQELRRFKVL
jgi:predicted metal-dependent hydrolase